MDFVKKAASGMGSNHNNAQAQGGQQDDYVDKGKSQLHPPPHDGPTSLIVPDANPRFTAAFGQANKSQGWGLTREKQEKITDGGRQVYEKVTGYVIFSLKLSRQHLLTFS
jgi:hypothetical protein